MSVKVWQTVILFRSLERAEQDVERLYRASSVANLPSLKLSCDDSELRTGSCLRIGDA